MAGSADDAFLATAGTGQVVKVRHVAIGDVNNDQSLKINYEDLIQTHEVMERRPPKMSRISSIQNPF